MWETLVLFNNLFDEQMGIDNNSCEFKRAYFKFNFFNFMSLKHGKNNSGPV